MFWHHIGLPALQGAGVTLLILLAAWGVGKLLMKLRR